MLRSDSISNVNRKLKAQAWAELFRARWPGLAARCNGRIESAVHIYQVHGDPLPGQVPGEYMVHSESARRHYVVDVIHHTCTCMDHLISKDTVCKHRLVAGMVLYGRSWEAEPSQIEDRRNLQAQLDELLKTEIRVIDRWERAGTTLRADGTYPSDAELAPLKQSILAIGSQIDELRERIIS